jgi:transposase
VIQKLDRSEGIERTRPIKYWCQDETRLGLKTINGKKITAKGVKAIGEVQWQFEAYYLYGAIAPDTGESFFLEFPYLNGDCFQIFLDNLAQDNADSLNVIQLDNGRFHWAANLKVPENVLLLFQPPYCPELNPIERLWTEIKKNLTWSLYPNLDALKERVSEILNDISAEQILSIAGWDYIRLSLLAIAS